jgi:hypothetical protein
MKQLSNPDTPPSVWRKVQRQCSDYLLLIVVALYAGTSSLANALSWWFKDNGPEIVVYMDRDAKQPALLPMPESQVVAGERATLWWSVFHKSVEKGYGISDSRSVANSAVDNVYGDVKK